MEEYKVREYLTRIDVAAVILTEICDESNAEAVLNGEDLRTEFSAALTPILALLSRAKNSLRMFYL